jgi:hypothetical protein
MPKLVRSIHVVAVVAVASVDDDVAHLEVVGHVGDHTPGDPGRHHHPDHAGQVEFRRDVRER